MDENFSDDVCHCVFCEAEYIMPFGSILIPISREYLDEILFKDSILFRRLHDNVQQNRSLTIPYAKNIGPVRDKTENFGEIKWIRRFVSIKRYDKN